MPTVNCPQHKYAKLFYWASEKNEERVDDGDVDMVSRDGGECNLNGENNDYIISTTTLGSPHLLAHSTHPHPHTNFQGEEVRNQGHSRTQEIEQKTLTRQNLFIMI